MSSNFTKFYNGINVVPQNATAVTVAGDVRFNSSSNKLEVFGTSSDSVVTEAFAATLTNKTIAAADNTISGLTTANFSGSAGITNANLAAMPTLTIKGNNTGGSTTPLDLTVSQVNTLLGTVTAVSVASSNGFAGSSSGGATPALTLSTSITGVLKGNGTALSAATLGTDYSGGTSALATGILKTTTSTGALSVAIAADFPTLNQNTTGTANNVSGIVAIANGGTGQITAAAGFNALSPVTSVGDLIIGNGTNSATRLAIGGNTTVLTSNGTTATWAAASGSSPLTTKGDLYTFSTVNARLPVGSDAQVVVGDSSQATGLRWTSTPNFGVKNYVVYNNFENNATTGWSLGTVGTLTNAVPTGTPTFGSGASGNLSISTVSSGQLAGTYSLSLASSAATTVGNMLATQAYTIDLEDQAKVLTFKFYYSAISGAANCNFSGTSSNSFGVAIWDVTNSAWLSSTANFGMTQSSGVGYCTGTFQTGATTASLRFVIYNANATAGAATLYFDDFSVSPQTAPTGPIITDWASYTPATAGLGSPTITEAYWKREGDSIMLKGRLTAGTTTGVNLQIGLPAGLTVDSSFETSTAGAGQFIAGGSATGTVVAIVTGGNAFFNVGTQTGGAALTPLLGNTYSVGQVFSWNVGPITVTGWSSNVQMSSDTDTRVIALQANTLSTTAQVSNTAMIFTTKVIDLAGSYNTSTGQYTAPISGLYSVTFGGTFSSATNSNISIFVNGSTRVTNAVSIVAGGARAMLTALVSLNAGDIITIVPAASFTAGDTGGYLSISRLSGPAVVAATESINARYFSSSTSITGSLATVAYSTKGWDSHNAYNSTTGLYTIPVSGKYQINASVAMTGTFVLNSILDLQVQQTGSGSQISESKSYSGGAVTQMNTNVGDQFSCLAGDVIKVQASNSGAAPVIAATTTQNWFSISRVGN